MVRMRPGEYLFLMRTGVRAAILFFALQAAIVHAQAADEKWTFSVMPYVWLPSIGGTLNYSTPAGGGTPTVTMDPDTWLKGLDMAFLISGEARKGRWLAATDYIYLDLGVDTSRVESVDFSVGTGRRERVFNTAVDTGTQTKIKGEIWSLIGGYAAVQDARATVDVFGGVRYFAAKLTTSWQLSATLSGAGGTQTFPAAGSVTDSDHIWDAIVGVKGRVRLGQGNWFMPYYLDAGAGDSTLTWQGMLGVGHAFKWGEVIFAYRYLSYQQESNSLIEDMTFQGFGLALNFRF